MTRAHLPKLPARLQAATLAAADNLAAIAAVEGVALVGDHGEASQSLYAILFTLRERCIQARSQPTMSDQAIEISEIAAVLETIAQVMVSDGLTKLAGHSTLWFRDAAGVVESLAQESR